MAPAAVRAVLTRLVVAKNFVPAGISSGETSALTITVTNPNAVLLRGIAFTDVYPPQIQNQSIPSAVVTGPVGCSGNLTAIAGGGSLAVIDAAVPAGSTCIFTVLVTSSTEGTYTDATGDLTTPIELNTNAATAILVVDEPDLAISTTHAGNFYRGQIGADYSI